MKNTTGFLLLFATIYLLMPDAARCEPASPSAHPGTVTWKPAAGYSQTRISVGARSLYIELLNDTKGRQMDNAFIGSIYKIEADQDFGSINPYIQVDAPVGKFDLGFGIGYDAFDVATVDSGTGDGDIELRNWLVYLTGAWPNQTRFKPFCEIGLFASHNSFDPIPSWSAGGRREFVLQDETSLYIAGGCDISIYLNWSLNLYARYTDFDIQGEYVFRGDSRAPEPFYFTLEHLAYGLGAQYSF